MITVNAWGILSLCVIFATFVLQVINFKVFHKDGRNSTRITLIVKEFQFAIHAFMVIKVTPVIIEHYSWWFGNAFGMFYFWGLLCWFFVFLRGLYPRDNG